MPRSVRGVSTFVNTRWAASQRSCGLNTLPTPVTGIGSIGMTCTGTAARSGVRSRTHVSSSPGSTVAPCFSCISHRQFAGIGVGLADHRGKADGGMAEHDLLDRCRINVVAAADHEILGAAGDPEITVSIEPAKIAGIDPDLVDESTLVVLVVEIAAEHAGPGHDDNADLVRRAVADQLAVSIELDNADPRVRHGKADRTESDRARRIGQRVNARGLGHTVDLD